MCISSQTITNNRPQLFSLHCKESNHNPAGLIKTGGAFFVLQEAFPGYEPT